MKTTNENLKVSFYLKKKVSRNGQYNNENCYNAEYLFEKKMKTSVHRQFIFAGRRVRIYTHCRCISDEWDAEKNAQKEKVRQYLIVTR